MTTPVEFHFVYPTGEPVANTSFEVALSKSGFNDTDNGIKLPSPIILETDADGRATVSLWPSNTFYYVTVQDTVSDGAIFYKFLVPAVEDGITCRLQDLVITDVPGNISYDLATLAAITEAKATVLGLREELETYASAATNAVNLSSEIATTTVNNTLATWPGTSNVTTVGTIGSGTWNATTIADGKIASALTGKTYNGLSLTANATGFSVAGGTTSKSLTVNNNLTLSGSDGASLAIGSGGTLGTGAYATIENYAPLASPTFTGTVGGITASMVGLENVTNESKATMFTNPTFTGTVRRSASVAVTAGTNAQGQGALTADFNVITTAAANPSGVTLPTAVAGMQIVVANRGANPVNVYPATGAKIDSLADNAPVSLPVNGVLTFVGETTTAWESSLGSVAPVISGLTTGLMKVTAGTGVITTASSGTDFQAPIGTISGLVKGNGANALTAATAADVTGQLLTGYASGSGTVAATDTILQGINKLNGNIALKANIASPVFTGNVTGLGVATGTSFNSITGLSSTTPVVAGTAAVGTGTTAARGDHVHPAQTTITGNAGTATTLETARNIAGVSFNGSADISIPFANLSTKPTSISGYGINDAYTKTEVDSLVTGLDFKSSVRVVATTNITLSGTQVIDNVSVVAGDRVLVAGQSTAANNGIYVVAADAWARATDADTSTEVTAGMYVFVSEGTTYADSGWVLATNDPITLGTTALTFTQFNGLGQITAGTGLTKTGNTINVIGTAGRIVSNVDAIDLATVTDSGAGTFKKVTVDGYGRVTGTAAVAQADITGLLGNGSISNAMLANGAVASLSGTNTGDQTIALTGEVTGSGTGSFATTVSNAAVIGKVLTGFTAGAGTVTATDSILTALQKVQGNVAAAPGTVTSVSVVTANGVSGSVATSSSTPAITLTLGAITPSSVAATGTVTGSNLSGTNTGDNAVNTNYSNDYRAANFVAGTNYLAPPTGTALLKANSGGALANAVVRTDYAEPTTGLATGLLKNTTGTGAHTIAAAGTEYAAPGSTTTYTVVQNFTHNGITLKGSSTGVTTFQSQNASATNYTIQFPAADATVLTTAAVVTAAQGGTGVNNGTRTLAVNTNSGTLAFSAASKTLTIANSLTLSGTDGASLAFGAGGSVLLNTDVGTNPGQLPTGYTLGSMAYQSEEAVNVGSLTAENISATTGLVLPRTSSTGIRVNTATPTWGWRDLTADIVVRGTGASDPTFALYGATALRAYQFSATVDQEVFMTFHVPHDWVPGTAIYFHAHWSNAAATPNTGVVRWGFEYAFAKGFNQEAFPTPTIVYAEQASSATRYQHMVTETNAVTIPTMEVDGLILVRAFRDADQANDTCTDAVFLHTVDIHYQSTNMATVGKAPSFY